MANKIDTFVSWFFFVRKWSLVAKTEVLFSIKNIWDEIKSNKWWNNVQKLQNALIYWNNRKK